MGSPRPDETQGLVAQLLELREALEGRLHRDTARVQLAFQRHCDRVYDESYAELCLTHDAEEAQRLAREEVRRFRAENRPRLQAVKRFIWRRKEVFDELMGILGGVGIGPRLAPGG